MRWFLTDECQSPPHKNQNPFTKKYRRTKNSQSSTHAQLKAMCRPIPSNNNKMMIADNTNNKSKGNNGSDKQFPGKLHDMMKYVESNAMEYIISWELNGFGLKINNPDKLVEILPLFFGQTKYRSFRRQLNMWHFHRILDGQYKGIFIHPYFVRHDVALVCQMSRHMPFKPSLEKEQEYLAMVSTTHVVVESNEPQAPRPEVQTSSSSSSYYPIKEVSYREKLTPSYGLPPPPVLSSSSRCSFNIKQLSMDLGLTSTTDFDSALQEIDEILKCDIETDDSWSSPSSPTKHNTTAAASHAFEPQEKSLGYFEGGSFFSLEEVFAWGTCDLKQNLTHRRLFSHDVTPVIIPPVAGDRCQMRRRKRWTPLWCSCSVALPSPLPLRDSRLKTILYQWAHCLFSMFESHAIIIQYKD